MAFGLNALSIDPTALIGSAIESVVHVPVIIGLPSENAPIPNFIIAIIPEEQASTSIALPGFQLTAGDLFMKSALTPGQYRFTAILSQNSMLTASWVTTISTALVALSGTANSIANFGAVLPNLAGLSTNYAVAQLSTLRNIKNGNQPILLLNSYIPLGSISQNNPYLSSNWYISEIDPQREEAEGGIVVQITLREILTKRNPTIPGLGKLSNFGSYVTNFDKRVALLG